MTLLWVLASIQFFVPRASYADKLNLDRFFDLANLEELDIVELKARADGGDAGAQWFLGEKYALGTGIPENDSEAVKWYSRSAEQGYVSAYVSLSQAYGEGEGVAQDYIEAYKWANLAAAQGNETAKSNKANLESKMTREQIAEAQRLSSEWKPKTE